MKDSFADVLKDMRSLVGNAPPDGRITVDTLEHFYQRLDGVAYYSGQYAEEQAEADARREISRLRAALTEARRWLADGDMSDDSGIPSAYWTPAYAAAIDMIDAALTPNATVRGAALKVE